MSDITLIGLGAMGSAIARSLIKSKFDITVWNRSPERMDNIVKLGAKGASSLEEAIVASPRIMICVSRYSDSHETLNQAEIIPHLSGKTILQLSTGTPSEVRQADRWFNEQGARYLDASIMVYPTTIGTEAGQLLISGDESVYRDCEPFIKSLGGDLRYLGSKIGAAAALDLAVLSRMCAVTPSVIHGALVCESEGVSLEQYADMFPAGDRGRSLALAIHNNEFEKDISASVNVAIGCISSIKSHSDDLNINSEVPEFLLSLYYRAAAAGYQHQDAASLIQVLRKAD